MSSHRKLHVKELSSNIMKMKFMQRNREQQIKEEEEREQQRALHESQWVIDLDSIKNTESAPKIETESSFLSFMDEGHLGRRSYQKFNNQIEKLTEEQLEEQKIKKTEEKEKKNTISEKEMVKRYEKDIGSLPTNKGEKRALKEKEKKDNNKKPKYSKNDDINSKKFIKPE